jgi:hypothetical protein
LLHPIEQLGLFDAEFMRLHQISHFSISLVSGYARDWPNEKLHQDSVLDFGGSYLQCRFCRRASELQENRQELPHER